MDSSLYVRILKVAAIGTALLCSTSFAQTTASDQSGTTTPSVALPMGGTAAAGQAAQSQNNTAQIMSAATAALMATQCNKPAGNVAPCIMAAMALAQALAAGQSAAGDGVAAGQYSTTAASAPTAGVAPTTGLAGVSGNISTAQAALSAAGASVSPDGSQISLPGGGTVPLEASSATTNSAGLTDAQIAQGQQALADVAKKLGVPMGKMDGDLGAGGGGGAGGGSGYTAVAGGGGGGRNVAGRGAKALAKPSLSGLTKNLGNDKIGIAADNIFEMVTRRYKAKDASGVFLKN